MSQLKATFLKFFFNIIIIVVIIIIIIIIKLINNCTIYKSMQYSTYITYNPNWHFYTEKERKKDYLECI